MQWLDSWGATLAEVGEEWESDRFVADPSMSETRAVDLAAPPDEVFPWLAQMGTGRAGWYSYDLIDNFGRRSARSLHPELMVRVDGDRVPAGPIDFVAAVVDAPDEFVLVLDPATVVRHHIEFSLAFVLRPNSGGTRLLSRARARIDGAAGRPAATLLRLGDGIMVRRQLLGIRQRTG